ncbi:hypothetical protein DICPUDRAFT_156422 [Dictyostelium purpureum]|uniref:Uncharacterized protein n=1 Tax=Dictyostelium purpureum TaxID=5786 RepID=F0ZWJ1_DICPU|nr:uncharacterized protein DICPUDRAFT_156422 [Dictyostelium purpureum]EGC31692.1 hypothetical protein DICPUDRAFT_156422 [Dictyostelium purpureum]|eukprot:XP_003291790.1 hypothetical protein DICPUDRAFT_156422 [Dictyostelium purpureum]
MNINNIHSIRRVIATQNKNIANFKGLCKVNTRSINTINNIKSFNNNNNSNISNSLNEHIKLNSNSNNDINNKNKNVSNYLQFLNNSIKCNNKISQYYNFSNNQSMLFKRQFGTSTPNNKDDKTNLENKSENNQINNNNNSNNNNNNNNNDNQENEHNENTNNSGGNKRYQTYRDGIFSFFSRLIAKVKYFLTRNKPLTSDQRIAIISWAAFGTGALVLIGTTSLVSLILFFANTFEFSELIAKKVGQYLTNNTGITITFERARGDLKTGYIRIENVNVSRTPRPDDHLSSIQLSIRQIDIKLNFLWFLEGKGLIQECLVNGVRGLIDRRTEGVYYNKNMVYPRRKKVSGDFEFEKLEVKDFLITMFLPDRSYRPLPISIYHLESDRFRKQWMLLDLLSCKSIIGKFDNSLFTFTIPQHHRPFNIESDDVLSKQLQSFTNKIQNFRNDNFNFEHFTSGSEENESFYLTHPNPSSQPPQPTLSTSTSSQTTNLNTNNNSNKRNKTQRDEKPEYRELKIDGLNIDILSRNATGPLGWIKEGTFDIDLLLLLPHQVDDKELLETEQVEFGIIPASENPRMNLHLDFKVQLNHLYSVAPLYTPEISYISNALAHPIVAYINSHSKHIPLSFKFAMNVRQFNGSWTPSQASFWDMISASVYEELLNKVQDTKNVTTLKKVASELVNDFVQWLAPHLQASHYHQKEKEEEEELLKLNGNKMVETNKEINNIDNQITLPPTPVKESNKIQETISSPDENISEEEPIEVNQQLVYYQQVQKLLEMQQQKHTLKYK